MEKNAVLASGVKLTKIFGHGSLSVTALVDADIEIRAGVITALVGPSGSGKSTLLSLLGGLDRPTSGTYTFRDAAVDEMSDEELTAFRGESIGFIFQDHGLVPILSLCDNVSLPLIFQGRPQKECRELARTALSRVGLAGLEARRPGQVSLGQRQRASVARALVTSPKLILADEPTASLDRANAEQVLELLGEAANAGAAVIIVTHDLFVARRADHLLYASNGRISSEPFENPSLKSL